MAMTNAKRDQVVTQIAQAKTQMDQLETKLVNGVKDAPMTDAEGLYVYQMCQLLCQTRQLMSGFAAAVPGV